MYDKSLFVYTITFVCAGLQQLRCFCCWRVGPFTGDIPAPATCYQLLSPLKQHIFNLRVSEVLLFFHCRYLESKILMKYNVTRDVSEQNMVCGPFVSAASLINQVHTHKALHTLAFHYFNTCIDATSSLTLQMECIKKQDSTTGIWGTWTCDTGHWPRTVLDQILVNGVKLSAESEKPYTAPSSGVGTCWGNDVVKGSWAVSARGGKSTASQSTLNSRTALLAVS